MNAPPLRRPPDPPHFGVEPTRCPVCDSRQLTFDDEEQTYSCDVCGWDEVA